MRFLCHFFCHQPSSFFSSFGIGLCGGQQGSLQRAATARTADGKNGQNGRRHSLDRLYASMNKKKILEHKSCATSPPNPMLSPCLKREQQKQRNPAGGSGASNTDNDLNR